MLSSANGDEREGKNELDFVGVILENRLSGATEWTDRDGTKCIGKVNVPTIVRLNKKWNDAVCPVQIPQRLRQILIFFPNLPSFWRQIT